MISVFGSSRRVLIDIFCFLGGNETRNFKCNRDVSDRDNIKCRVRSNPTTYLGHCCMAELNSPTFLKTSQNLIMEIIIISKYFTIVNYYNTNLKLNEVDK